MNWYKSAKHDFDFGKERKTLWNKMLNEEMDRRDIHFDLENDDSVGDIKRIGLGITGRGGLDDKEYAVFACMYTAGGDWENPIVYFRCELAIGTRRDHKFIFIPSYEEGNENLFEEDGKWHAQDSNSADWSKRDEPRLWKALKEYAIEVTKRDKADEIEYDDPTFMRNLADR